VSLALAKGRRAATSSAATKETMRFTSILIPTDFGEPARQAIDVAVGLAKTFESKLTLVHGFEVPAYAYMGLDVAMVDYLTPIEDAARKQLDDELAKLVKRWPRSSALFMKGPPWQQVLRACEEVHPDLIVMGTHGRKGISHALLGSVAEKVVRLASVPVLIARGTVTE
jgi:nucleotide-binding universal stress UspA family protein